MGGGGRLRRPSRAVYLRPRGTTATPMLSPALRRRGASADLDGRKNLDSAGRSHSAISVHEQVWARVAAASHSPPCQYARARRGDGAGGERAAFHHSPQCKRQGKGKWRVLPVAATSAVDKEAEFCAAPGYGADDVEGPWGCGLGARDRINADATARGGEGSWSLPRPLAVTQQTAQCTS
ncbi:hypothetical protein C8R47DRAFT_213626 [Mycena vitilis]|nr:hypothetical protein C8R47DRAFT_213626 [Mycena vitilis]